ncbi:MAG: FGGY family carbohydrate kinase [Desulfobacteraceae bacterium]|jgi:sugar (pentulose or hexulose) kinase
MTILGVDIGTTGMKMGIFRVGEGVLTLIGSFSKAYEIHTYNDGLYSDIDPKKWQEAFVAGCRELHDLMGDVEVISISGTTPGLTAMDRDGNALYPAILMLDQRSRQQAQHIISTVGMKRLMDVTGNLPVAGGCSLSSILWIRDTHPDIFEKTYVFGHSNTFVARWLTGKSAIDPSSASLTALYNTAKNDLKWNKEIAEAFGLSLDRLPKAIRSHESTGRLTPQLAAELGLRKEPAVVIGGNDAVLAAYSVGIHDPGDIINVNGTCEITLVCLPKCIPSKNYNVRTHVLSGRWLTLYVMNAGGTALEWFRNAFCCEIIADEFYTDFLPNAIDTWLDRESGVTYIPYLLGSRYSLEPLKAAFLGLTAETTREELLAALVKGLSQYQREHIKEISIEVPLKKVIHITGGAVSPAIIRSKKKWMRNCEYIHEQESSMKGAALLGMKFLEQAVA